MPSFEDALERIRRHYAHDHGYDGNAGRIELEIECALNQFAVTIHHEGKEFLTARWPEPPDPRIGNGYGLQIIRELMDETDFQEAGPVGGTTLRMAINTSISAPIATQT